MDNAQKAIMIGVGLFITILVISIVLLVLNVGMTTTKSTTSKLTAMTPELEQQLTTMYVGRTVIKEDCEFIINQYNSKLKNNIFLVQNDTSGNISAAYKYDKEITANAKVDKVTSNDYYTNSIGGTTVFNYGAYSSYSLQDFLNRFDSAKTYKCYLLKDNTTKAIVGLVLLEL